MKVVRDVSNITRKSHRSVYMVERKAGTGYRKTTRGEIVQMRNAGTIRLEGVDGDEDANTVTYWYGREDKKGPEMLG